MKYKINWAGIREGHKGFEKLAVRYVQLEYDKRFQRTGDTRDGNKDAHLVRDGSETEYTIVLGFRMSENACEEWWMEAKYSNTEERLTRYRLDPTLVSAILKGTVGRIIFVTNINVDTQTIIDIRQAVTSATNCKEVDFCTKDRLEYWLYQNKDVLNDFFPDYSGDDVQLPDLVLVEPMDFYTADKSALVFRESLRMLEIGRTYVARFSVYSSRTREVSILLANGIKGISGICPKKWALQPGINDMELQFYLSPKRYGYRSEKRKKEHAQLPQPAFRLEGINVFPKRSVTVSDNPWKNFSTPSQNGLFNKLKRNYTDFLQKGETRVLFIRGQSGVGKTRVLDDFITYAGKSNCLIYASEMSGGLASDFEDVARCVDFICFPYLPAGSVNKNYLDELDSKRSVTKFYYDMICCAQDVETLARQFSRYISEDVRLFPKRFRGNPRVIIFDNTHAVSTLAINVIYKMIMELSMVCAPFMFILSGQTISHTEYYTELAKMISVSEDELQVTVDDCLSLLPKDRISPKARRLFQENFLFSNILEMLFFTQYLLDHGKSVKDFHDFSLLYRLFFHEDIMTTYIKRLFHDAVYEDPDTDTLCNEVYWNPSGADGADLPQGKKLLGYHLAKVDSLTGRLIPYHDIYTACYRRTYNCRSLFEISFARLLEERDAAAIETAIEGIHQEFEKKHYIVVYYSLEPIYRDAFSAEYRNQIRQGDYYTLFYEYALSCAHCSMDYASGRMFERLYWETKELTRPDAQTRKVCNAALWELTNSTFEALNYVKAKGYADKLIKNTADLAARHIFKDDPRDSVRYHNANVIRGLIKSELQEADSASFFHISAEDMERHGFPNRAWSYRVRYSLTLMQRTPEDAVRILSECCTHYDRVGVTAEKYLFWAHFYLSYLKMIVYDDLSSEDDALLYLDRLHDRFFNDYRKAAFGMVVYFYYRGEIERGDRLLLSDSYVMRGKRPRLEGFFHLAYGLRNVITDNIQDALAELKKASAIFKDIPSYSELIQHNIGLLERGGRAWPIRYYLGGPIEMGIYYLDIRGCW